MALEILTINKIVYLFKQFQLSNPMLNDFGYGPLWDFGVSRQMRYPAMWTDLQTDSSILISNRNIQPTIGFNIMFCDIVNIQQNYNNTNGYSSDNREHIMSDCYQTGQDFLNYLLNDLKPLGISVADSVTTTKVDDETADKICGWVFGIQLTLRHYNCGVEAQQLLGDFNDDWNNDYNN